MRRGLRALAVRLICAALPTACVYHPPAPRADAGIRYSVDGWLLETRTDPFTRVTQCRIADRLGHDPDVTVTPAALTFRFARRLDTSDAWYRVGDGPPRPWADLLPQLIQTGSIAQAERLDNPSGGRVTIPQGVLAGAGAITVRPWRHAPPRRFDLKGTGPLLHAAAGLNRAAAQAG